MIYVSAGHHPLAKGAHHGDFWEHDEAVRWRDELVVQLGGKGVAVPVPMVASPGAEKEKAGFINSAADARLAVEIHFNSLDTTQTLPSERGCLTYYYPGSLAGRRMAQRVQRVLRKFFLFDLGAHEGYVRMEKARGIIWFLRDTKCPALLIEPQFIDRQADIQGQRAAVCAALAPVLIDLHDNAIGA